MSKLQKSKLSRSAVRAKEWKTLSYHCRVKSSVYRLTRKICKNNWFRSEACQSQFLSTKHFWSSKIFVLNVLSINNSRGLALQIPKLPINSLRIKNQVLKISELERQACSLTMLQTLRMFVLLSNRKTIKPEQIVYRERYRSRRCQNALEVKFNLLLYKCIALLPNFSLSTRAKTFKSDSEVHP